MCANSLSIIDAMHQLYKDDENMSTESFLTASQKSTEPILTGKWTIINLWDLLLGYFKTGLKFQLKTKIYLLDFMMTGLLNPSGLRTTNFGPCN